MEHSCFSSSAQDCCCDFRPRRPPAPTGSDFVAQNDHRTVTRTKSTDISKRVPLFTERRQRYEDIKTTYNGQANRTSDKGKLESTLEEEYNTPEEIDDPRLLRVKSFREEHMNECMSTINQHLYKRINKISIGSSGHRCCHRFIVNEQNQLMAKNSNESGQSACEKCGKVSDPWEIFKGQYRWSKGDQFSTNRVSPKVVIEELPEQLIGTKKSTQKGQPREKKVTFQKENYHQRTFAIPCSSALIYQKTE